MTDEPIAEYHAADAVSKTKVDTFRHNPELYRGRFVTKEIPKPEPTEAMIIGNAVGALTLEGSGAFLARYAEMPEDAPRRPTQKQRGAKKPSPETTAAIEWWDDFAEQTRGKEVLTPAQRELVARCNVAIRNNKTFADLTATGQPEVTFRIQGQAFAVQVRPDWWNEDGCSLTDGYPLVVDLKTIAELPQDDPEYLSRHIATYGYHRSAYLYPEITAHALGWKPEMPRPRFFLAFVEKQDPFHTEIVELTEFDVEVGQREVTHSLTQLRKCMTTGIWSTPQTDVRKVSLPPWYIKKTLEASEAILA